MSPKIVFNGREYDGVESMPAEVRQEYERALAALGAVERDKLEVAMGRGGLNIKLNLSVHRKFKVNGKEYDSIDAMPPEARAAYEKALQATPSLRDTATSLPKASSGVPVVPPAIDAADDRRSAIVRVLVWVAIGAVVLVWLLSRR